jgi:hypothetical protein
MRDACTNSGALSDATGRRGACRCPDARCAWQRAHVEATEGREMRLYAGSRSNVITRDLPLAASVRVVRSVPPQLSQPPKTVGRLLTLMTRVRSNLRPPNCHPDPVPSAGLRQRGSAAGSRRHNAHGSSESPPTWAGWLASRGASMPARDRCVHAGSRRAAEARTSARPPSGPAVGRPALFHRFCSRPGDCVSPRGWR